MSKKDTRIHELEVEIKELKKLRCTNDNLQLIRYCSEVEKAVNHPDFEPGSLKLVPRKSPASAYFDISSEVEIFISTIHCPAGEKEKTESVGNKTDWAAMWEKLEKEGEIAGLKIENKFLKLDFQRIKKELDRMKIVLGNIKLCRGFTGGVKK